MRAISQYDIDELIRQAENHPRKRAMLRLHEHHEPVQRMINAMVPGTYFPPHKHENPDKVELVAVLKGKVACVHFDNLGDIEEIFLLDQHGAIKMVEVPPRTYHTLLVLEPSALLEIIQGPYDEATHKHFAPWAPREETAKAADYVLHLASIVENLNK